MVKHKYLSEAAGQELADKYASGSSVDELAAAYGIHKATVRNYLLRAGAVFRTPRGRKKELTEALVIEAKQMRAQGICWKNVEKRIGMGKEVLRVGMKRMEKGLPV